MATYSIVAQAVQVSGKPGTLLKLGFGSPAQNDEIVRAVDGRLDEMIADGSPEASLLQGPLVLLNGPASLPVAVVLAHTLAHRFANVAVFDPKMAGYVVCTAHGGDRKLGDVIAQADVKVVES